MDTELPNGTAADIPVVIPAIEMTESPHRAARNTRPNILAAGLAMMLAIGGGVALLADDQGTTTAASSTKLTKLKLAAPGLQESRSADTSMMPSFNYKYAHTGAWPALNSTAPVYKLVGTSIDATEAARLAAVLGVNGPARQNENGWLITEGEREVSITSGDGGYSVALYSNVGMAIGGSTGSSGASGSDGAGTGAAEPDQPVEPTQKTTAPGDVPTPETDPAPDIIRSPDPIPTPKNLPTDGEAIKIVERAIDALGLDATFEYEAINAAMATVGGGCGPTANCVVDSSAIAMYSRSVLAHQLVDGHRVSGLTWSFEIGDNGVMQSAYGTIAAMEKMGDYPLRSIQSVYDDIVAGTFYGGQPMPMAAAEIARTVDTVPAPPRNDIAVLPPSPGVVDPRCLAKECAIPEPGIAPPDSTIAPVVSTVSVDGVQVASQVWYGFDGTTATTYIVPMYSFSGTVTSPDNPGSPWTSDYIALDQSFIDATTPPEPTGDDTKVTIEPQPPVVVPGKPVEP